MSTCEEKRQLNFHKYVEPGNFCCNDGTCFTSEHVCDGAYNCATEEDEDDCAKVKLPTHYNKYDPPNEIFVNLTIVDIMDINEEDSTFDIYFGMIIKLRFLDSIIHHFKSLIS